MKSRCLLWAAMPAIAVIAGGADWLQFRGEAGKSSSPEKKIATSLNQKNVAWKTAIPGRAVSGPIVVQGKVIVTSSSGPTQSRLHVLCVDAKSGKLDWERQIYATGRTACHPTSAVAAPTPASDGELIFAFYSSNDCICYDLQGNLQWLRGLSHDFPNAANDVGMASSPLVVGETLVVQVENKGESFAAGLDKFTGETRWQVKRTSTMNWVSPIALKGENGEGDLVLLQSPTQLSAHEALSGNQVWTLDLGCSSISSGMVDGNKIFVPANGVTVLEHGKATTGPKEMWKQNKLSAANASPILHKDRVYSLNGAGVLNCGKAENGELLWQLRLKGPFWATPIAVGEHLVAVNQQGLIQIVKLNDQKGEAVGDLHLGEDVLGSPAFADGALYVRGVSHLWKVE